MLGKLTKPSGYFELEEDRDRYFIEMPLKNVRVAHLISRLARLARLGSTKSNPRAALGLGPRIGLALRRLIVILSRQLGSASGRPVVVMAS